MATVNLTKKAMEKNSSDQLNKMFTITKPIHPRNGKSLRIDHKGGLKKSQNMFSVIATNTFNSLPQNLKDPDLTNQKFKLELKKFSMTQNLLQKH